jgi:hypothetical protein
MQTTPDLNERRKQHRGTHVLDTYSSETRTETRDAETKRNGLLTGYGAIQPSGRNNFLMATGLRKFLTVAFPLENAF